MRRNGNALSLSILLLLSCWPSAPVGAADWHEVGISDDKTVYWVEVQSLSKQGDIVVAWIKKAYADPQSASNGATYNSDKVLRHFDCKKRQSGIKAMSFYSGADWSGSVVYTGNVSDEDVELSDIVPDTIGEAVLAFVCSKAPTK